MEGDADAAQNDQNAVQNLSDLQPSPSQGDQPPPPLSKNAQKKLLKQKKYEAKKAEKKALIKEQKKREAERKRKEWEEALAGVSEEERLKLIESRRELRKERMEKRSEERESKIQRLTGAKTHGQKIVIDLEFSHLMTSSEIHSLVQQVFPAIIYSIYNCYWQFQFKSMIISTRLSEIKRQRLHYHRLLFDRNNQRRMNLPCGV